MAAETPTKPPTTLGLTGLTSNAMALIAPVPSPFFMIVFCPIFAFAVAYIAYRGVGGTTAVNAAINVIQISALIVFSIMAIAYRVNHPEGSRGWTLDPAGNPVNVVLKV